MTTTLIEPVCFVLGAGFSKAFDNNAPLVNINPYDIYDKTLHEKYLHFSNIDKILRTSYAYDKDFKRYINIETLLSRLSIGVPYDDEILCEGERKILFNDVSNNFLKLIGHITDKNLNKNKIETLQKFAKYVIDTKSSCVTFNYDTLLDKALFNVNPISSSENLPPSNTYWNPDGGYGFFCRPEDTIINDDLGTIKDITSTVLLKLHGSINWKIKKGYKKPYPIDAIVHSEGWYNPGTNGRKHIKRSERKSHLETLPLIIPPILSKSTLNEEPIFRIIWGQAYQKLFMAKTIVFIGYSLPKTDIATMYLLQESIRILKKNIIIVNKRGDQKVKKLRYTEIFGDKIPKFDFSGAIKWINTNL